MKVTKRRLRRIIHETIEGTGNDTHTVMGVNAPADHYSARVPVPEEYDAVRDLMNGSPDAINMGVQLIMDIAGTSCQRSSLQAVVYHLQALLDGTGEQAPPRLEESLW
jgi:hypothetical protein